MKKLFYYLMICTSTIIYAQETAQTTETQQLIWKGSAAVGGYSPEGTLDITSAKITYTATSVSNLEIEVNMKSLQQENKQLEGHLRQKDFFHVRKYPTATFILMEPIDIKDGNVQLIGTMTIKKKSLQEIITAMIRKTDNGIVLKFEHTMDRTLYGITYNSPSVFEKIKENAIADDFILKGALRFEKN